MHAHSRHRNLLRRDLGRRRRRDRRRGAAVGDPLERRRLAGARFTASGAASCPSSPRASTSATSAASSSARWTRRRRRGAISARSPSRRARAWSARCSSACRSPRPRPRPPACRSSPCIISPATSSRSCCRTASCRCRRSCSSCRAATPACISSSARARTSCSAARATMRRARRTTRWRSCSASAIRAGRSSIGWRRRGNDRAVALPTTRLTHADRNAPELKGDLDFSFSGLKTAVLRHVRGRAQGAARPTQEIADICASFQRVVVTALIERTVRRRAALSARRASASPAACRRTAGCAPSCKTRGDAREMPTFLPSLALSTDNAAMIAAAGLRKFRAGHDRVARSQRRRGAGARDA